jgi:hypothetical protein
MIQKYTSLLIIVATNLAMNAADPFKVHNEIIRKDRERSARVAAATAQQCIQQNKPVPPMPFLPAHTAIKAQQHNARLASASQQPTTVEEQLEQLRARQKSDGCVLQ